MRKYFLALFTAYALIFTGCTNGQTGSSNTNLSATEFAEKIKELPSASIVDVRTPEEFLKGHLPNAKNVDWNGSEFQNQISHLDKSEPVFVYCLSGGRSSAAAKQMRADGFKQVFELSGGILKWRAANLGEITGDSSSSPGMTKQQFDDLLKSDKLVLVDFYADWCAPCKEMKPYLNEISKNMAEKITLISINVDDNQSLCKEIKIDTLPVLQLYKNKTLSWTNIGYISKEDVLKQIQ